MNPTDGNGTDGDREPPAGADEGAPRWVKAFWVVLAVVALVLAVSFVARWGNHGPSLHGAAEATGARVASAEGSPGGPG